MSPIESLIWKDSIMFAFIKTISSFINERTLMRDADKATRKVQRLIVECSNEYKNVTSGYRVDGGEVDHFVGRKNLSKKSLVWGVTPWSAVDIEQGRAVAQSECTIALSPGFPV